MNCFRQVILSGLVVCCCMGDEPVERASGITKNDDLPAALDALISEIVENTSDLQKEEIRRAPDAEVVVDHFGAGLALRNNSLNQKDSEVRKCLVRKGLFHPDDLSSIVLLSTVRRIRGEPIGLDDQIEGYREYWRKLDQVAPLDRECPRCEKEMEVGFWGAADPANPGKLHFRGTCKDGHAYFFYHKDGWRPVKDFGSNQVATPKP